MKQRRAALTGRRTLSPCGGFWKLHWIFILLSFVSLPVSLISELPDSHSVCHSNRVCGLLQDADRKEKGKLKRKSDTEGSQTASSLLYLHLHSFTVTWLTLKTNCEIMAPTHSNSLSVQHRKTFRMCQLSTKTWKLEAGKTADRSVTREKSLKTKPSLLHLNWENILFLVLTGRNFTTCIWLSKISDERWKERSYWPNVRWNPQALNSHTVHLLPKMFPAFPENMNNWPWTCFTSVTLRGRVIHLTQT